jgi:hypothetical protein
MRDTQHPSPEEMTAHLAKAVYEPTYQDPARELEVCLNFYRALLDELREYNDMEVAAHLCYRDGIAWALEQLDSRVDQRIQQEVRHLDGRLRAERDYQDAGCVWGYGTPRAAFLLVVVPGRAPSRIRSIRC